ncbi:hypothetical protein RA307_15480 [Xanthobacteraceae bacterium Astr-EGSB]|uniref:hypothetical protein n=1 Tax=Astrobacterium formosum TaxID=3069710 RepID=UPI0027B6814E|nr:hypothetical protein [Xanthobacteraceae bacterium Astr-EGSB]
MRFLVAFVLGFLVPSTPALSDWKIDRFKDRMTDRAANIASVTAKAPSSGISAQLQLECLEDELVGGWQVSAVLSAKMTRGRLGLSFRIDDNPVEARILPVSTDLRSIPFLFGRQAIDLERSRRLRLQLHPTGGPVLFYEFETNGAARALRAVPCNNHSPPSTTGTE